MHHNLLAAFGAIVPQCDPFQCNWNDFNELISNILGTLVYIVVPLGGLMVVYGGFLMLTSGGKPAQITKGRNTIIAAITGAAIVFGSLAIVNLIKSVFGG